MKIIDVKEQPNTAELTDKQERNLKIKAFQHSEHFDIVMEIIQESLNYSIVQDLLTKNNGVANEAEIGRLTLVEWAARAEIQKIKNKLEKNYG